MLIKESSTKVVETRWGSGIAWLLLASFVHNFKIHSTINENEVYFTLREHIAFELKEMVDPLILIEKYNLLLPQGRLA